MVSETVAHLAAGTIAGMSQLIVGHPFDTIKVRSRYETEQVPTWSIHFLGNAPLISWLTALLQVKMQASGSHSSALGVTMQV